MPDPPLAKLPATCAFRWIAIIHSGDRAHWDGRGDDGYPGQSHFKTCRAIVIGIRHPIRRITEGSVQRGTQSNEVPMVAAIDRRWRGIKPRSGSGRLGAGAVRCVLITGLKTTERRAVCGSVAGEVGHDAAVAGFAFRGDPFLFHLLGTGHFQQGRGIV